MEVVLLTIHLLIVLLLIIVVLFQPADSSGLLSSNHTGGLMSSRGSTNFLMKLTKFLGAGLFIMSLALALYGRYSNESNAELISEITGSENVLPEIDSTKPIVNQDILGSIGGDVKVTPNADNAGNEVSSPTLEDLVPPPTEQEMQNQDASSSDVKEESDKKPE